MAERELHYDLGHFCAGCNNNDILHKGCPALEAKEPANSPLVEKLIESPPPPLEPSKP